MGTLSGKVALVTGASRGVGKGIAVGLGEAGATVYVTGRTVDPAHPTVPLAGTIHHTGEEVTRLGGKGFAVQCDHRDDAQVEAVFKRIQQEQGRLDILVNNAWAGYEGYHEDRYPPPDVPFWERPVSFWEENFVGIRWTYVASVYALGTMMVARKQGLIVHVSASPWSGNPAYGAAKTAVDRLASEMAHVLQAHNIAVVSLHPGLVRTEGIMAAAQYFDLTNSESPQFSGRAVAHVAADPNLIQCSGQTLVVAKLAQDYNFDDIDGRRPTPA